MSRNVCARVRWCAQSAVVAAVMGGAGVPVLAQSAFHTYGASYRAISMPANGSGSFRVAGGVLPDGRIIVVTGTTIYGETGVRSGQFSPVANLDPAFVGGGTDPAFLRVSPGGTIAVGAGFNRPVVVFGQGALGAPGAPSAINSSNAAAFNVGNFDGAWADGTHLALTAGAFGSASYVTLLDTTSSPSSPLNPRIVSNIGGASAGVAFDHTGRLYTGNGFDGTPGGSDTGWIKAFDAAVWMNPGVPADFENGGMHIATLLSGSALGFDSEGNMFAGGGVFGGDAGFGALVSATAVGESLASGNPIDPNDPTQLRRLDPRGDPGAMYDMVFNPVTGELYLGFTNFSDGSNTWYATVPAPGAGVVMMGGVILARRRRRHG